MARQKTKCLARKVNCRPIIQKVVAERNDSIIEY
ncbi:hypothetical protein M5D96_009888 [Drosophila gunungcola]|uniref:Uncharacterized protein n=1 Tax=Drosophila gunungcola TaxID=103775 RepID=A0A9P9YHZ1_9MUSC|nr:hypothetical protein M5D96_009888 [Drosophila gunungcola]